MNIITRSHFNRHFKLFALSIIIVQHTPTAFWPDLRSVFHDFQQYPVTATYVQLFHRIGNYNESRFCTDPSSYGVYVFIWVHAGSTNRTISPRLAPHFCVLIPAHRRKSVVFCEQISPCSCFAREFIFRVICISQWHVSWKKLKGSAVRSAPMRK